MNSPIHTFIAFRPTLIKSILHLGLLAEDYKRSGLLVCGEIHGIQQNADIAFTLCTVLGCDILAIEQSFRYSEPLIASALKGRPNFEPFDHRLFVGSMLSVEMLKAIVLLLQSGRIKDIVYVDSHSADRERVIASKILSCRRSGRTVCILGNHHTMPRPTGRHSIQKIMSAAARVSLVLPNTPILRYRYLSGAFYNIGTGYRTFSGAPSHGARYAVVPAKCKSAYELIVPYARPVSYVPGTLLHDAS